MIASADKYIMNFTDYSTRAHIEINKLAFYRDATVKKFKQVCKLATAWQYFDMCEDMADDIKELMRNINYYFGGAQIFQERLYKRLYKMLKYLEATYIIDIEDFAPELASL